MAEGNQWQRLTAERKFRLFLAIHQVTHRNTKKHAPCTNGFCERLHRTVSDEFFNVALRKALHLILAELQCHLNAWLETHKAARPHHGVGQLLIATGCLEISS